MVHDRYTYLIVGGGMAADAAAYGIREVDPDGTIGLISSEPDPPYKRPPLSKKLWRGKPLESIWLSTDQLGVEVHLGRTGRLLISTISASSTTGEPSTASTNCCSRPA